MRPMPKIFTALRMLRYGKLVLPLLAVAAAIEAAGIQLLTAP